MTADVEAERHVLGSFLQDPEAIHRAIPILGERPGVFYKESHQAIYEAMLRLLRRGDPIDAYTTAAEMGRSGDRQRSAQYLRELQESVPSAANVEFYARIVREKAVRRALIEVGNRVALCSTRDDVPLEELIDRAQRLILEASQDPSRRGFADLELSLRETMRQIDELRQGSGRGVSTGFLELDRLLSGLVPSDLVVLAARPSMGKSALAHNICGHVAFRERRPVAIFTLEMDRRQVLTRMLAAEARVDMQRVRTGDLNADDWRRLCDVTAKMENAPLFIDDAPGVSAMEIRAETRRLKIRRPDLALVVVDYLQLIGEGSKSYQNREQEISDYSRSLKELARELDVTVLALSQLNRAVESRSDKRPQLADLRESGAIEQDADVVMFLYRDEYYYPDSQSAGQAEVIVRKHRNGPLGTVSLAFHPQYLLFHSFSL
ncbi:MAG: replicative DNA helicase [bacterium JZ-2024 1]